MENLSKYNYYRKDDDTILDANQEAMYEDASKWKRFANYIIDLIGFYALVFITGIIFALSNITIEESKLNDYIFGITIMILYYMITEGLSGRSLGKLITKTKVINMENEKPTFINILGRTLCRFIPFEAFSFLGDGNGWHDKASKTRVVNIKKKNQETIFES